MGEIAMNRNDVTVEENVEECEICTATLTGPSYRVMLDFRNAGFVNSVVEAACLACAEEMAARIREGLPQAAER